MDVGVQVEGGMRMSYDPDTVYENLKISVEMMGLRMPTEMELYILQEEDKVACYSNMGGSWLRSEVDAALQNDGSASAAIWNLPPEQLSIDKEVTELEGTPAICLIGQITGKEISQALGFLFSSLENSAGLSGENQPEIDWEKITAQVSADVDKETYLPLRAQISVQGLDEVLAGLMGNGASLSIQNADITVEYASHEPVEPCVLPEGAKEAAEQAQRLLEGNPDNGDGTFTIQESGYYTDITAPEGYVLDYVNYDEVDFYSEELDRKVCYQMWTTADSNDFFFLGSGKRARNPLLRRCRRHRPDRVWGGLQPGGLRLCPGWLYLPGGLYRQKLLCLGQPGRWFLRLDSGHHLRRRQHPGYLHHPGGGAGTAGPGPPVSAPGSPAGDGRSAG